ncbi:uncharacterized protein LOC142358607 [Convolutriloba macropyga]|uniref:uncharacterized protein LOC142358607 n=1 Tax=Convolutriloba macropyga TaxID=536237 RepID=UPI003F52766B
MEKLRRVEECVGKLKEVVSFGPILICLDEDNQLFMLTIGHLHDFLEGKTSLDKKPLQTSLTENVAGEIGSMCFGYSQNSFIVAMTEFGGFNRVATCVFEKS